MVRMGHENLLGLETVSDGPRGRVGDTLLK
jgi:hypothetical protein